MDTNVIDRLEDQLIDHPDEATRHELAGDTLDSTFQSKLKAMAEQIERQDPVDDDGTPHANPDDSVMSDMNYQFLITRSHLNYQYSEFDDLATEVKEWFSFSDFKEIGGLEDLAHHFNRELDEHIDEHGDLSAYEKLLQSCMDDIADRNLADDSYMVTMPLKVVCYYALGEYKQPGTTKAIQTKRIANNNEELIDRDFFKPVINLLVGIVDSLVASEKWDFPQSTSQNYFRVLTLVYLMVNVAIRLNDSGAAIPQQTRASLDRFLDYLDKTDLLSKLVKLLEVWKWHPSRHFRMRYVIMLVWKLMLFEFGTESHRQSCDEFLVELHNITNKCGRDLPENRLVCSPLDYFSFREDIVDKYPLYNNLQQEKWDDMEEKFAEEFDTSLPSISSALPTHSAEENYQFFMAINSQTNSLSNLIETPRTTKSHTVLSQLPAPVVHIATPVPSPNLAASDYMSGGEKIRRSYQMNQAMPFLYPSLADNTEHTVVPVAIEEADKLFRSSIYESYSTKRLWNERTKFMKQERGYMAPAKDDEFEYAHQDLAARYPNQTRQIRSILRVEKFYRNSFVQLHTFVQVLIELIKLNKLDYNLNYPEWELDPERSYFKHPPDIDKKGQMKSVIDFVLYSQLEVVNIKEITLKAGSAIILLMLRWFKINHVLKYYYLSSILFDQQFFAVSLDYISRGFNNTNLQTDTSQATDEVSEYEILINQNKIMNPQIDIPQFDFFNQCQGVLPDDPNPIILINRSKISDLPRVVDANNINNVYLEKYNRNYCFILSNLLKTNNKLLLKNQTQRIFTMNELKPSELYKMILINYDCPALTMPILKILKKLVPYQGRKWKSSNMDLISQIYLNLRLSLKDNWLSGKDLETDFNNSYDQEIALRALLQFYNISRYPDEMEKIGYKANSNLDIPALSLDDDSY
ncbi:hypothetical protein DIURU_001160 [Diutina rugosa]|uniref:Factor arrest protein 11 n=1 Tax=Diutina rugosa TaxID=5481 RepID=A0A642UVE9_DIURU|nr:uncharacterized protein DIURU_001160 [Diutina rugosa]KAA8906218.1 hypothetical protein DIURU_001160 [Diutina rugosa]